MDEGLKYPSFQKHVNVVKPYFELIEKDKWLKYAAVDVGSGGKAGHPAAIVFLAVRPDFQKACMDDPKRAVELDKLLQPLHTSLFIESNPSPVKYAASLLGLCTQDVRLPLVEISQTTKNQVQTCLKENNLI